MFSSIVLVGLSSSSASIIKIIIDQHMNTLKLNIGNNISLIQLMSVLSAKINEIRTCFGNKASGKMEDA